MIERRNPFRSSLVILPMWRRWLFAALAFLSHVLAFIPLMGQAGVGVSALAIFPVSVFGWLFGAGGGLVAGILSVPVNAFLLNLAGEPGWQIVLGGAGVEGSALVLVVGSVIGLFRDFAVRLDSHLTEWRRAERGLRDAEDRYRILFQRSRDPMYVSSPEGRLIDANDALLRLVGVGRDQLESVQVADLYEDPADRDRFQEQIARAGFVQDFPVRLKLSDGIVRECLITASERYGQGPARRVVEYQGSIRNVSESRTLHSLAERRTHQLQEVVRELETFTYSVSHDLRTHLVTIGGFASILWSEYRDDLDPKARGFLERIVTASGRMDVFVQDLLNYSRVSRAEVRKERVELKTVVQTALGVLAPAISARNAIVEVAPDLPAVEADATLIDRAIENLLSNAVKFVPADRTPEIRIDADVEERRVRLKIRDNGIGISAETVQRAFRPFERLDPANFSGTGVGLTIVERAVERMGGEVGVRSEPGRGSTFWILLPSAEPEEFNRLEEGEA